VGQWHQDTTYGVVLVANREKRGLALQVVRHGNVLWHFPFPLLQPELWVSIPERRLSTAWARYFSICRGSFGSPEARLYFPHLVSRAGSYFGFDKVPSGALFGSILAYMHVILGRLSQWNQPHYLFHNVSLMSTERFYRILVVLNLLFALILLILYFIFVPSPCCCPRKHGAKVPLLQSLVRRIKQGRDNRIWIGKMGYWRWQACWWWHYAAVPGRSRTRVQWH